MKRRNHNEDRHVHRKGPRSYEFEYGFDYEAVYDDESEEDEDEDEEEDENDWDEYDSWTALNYPNSFKA